VAAQLRHPLLANVLGTGLGAFSQAVLAARGPKHRDEVLIIPD
jgi:hypothetical protein